MPPAPAGINADIWAKHRENVQIVVHDPKFSAFAKRDPRAIAGAGASGPSGHQAPLVNATAIMSLQRTDQRMCAVSVFWFDPFY